MKLKLEVRHTVVYFCINYILVKLLEINMPKVTVMVLKYLSGEFWDLSQKRIASC